jgi:hypothetical protein
MYGTQCMASGYINPTPYLVCDAAVLSQLLHELLQALCFMLQ